jgi:hypothetical protein
MKRIFALSLLVLAGCSTAPQTSVSSAQSSFQRVELREFFAEKVIPLPLSMEIPGEYAYARDLPVPLDYAYWMRASDVQAARQGTLPAGNGFIYGKISLDVGYDVARDSFGEESLESEMSAAGMQLHKKKRHRVGAFPVLDLEIVAPGGTRVCARYIATLVSTNVLYIAYRPAGNDSSLCQRFHESLQVVGEQG